MLYLLDTILIGCYRYSHAIAIRKLWYNASSTETFSLSLFITSLTVLSLSFQVVISGALCTVEDYVIMSQCAHNKAIHLAAEGTVSVTDISQIRK